MRAIGVRSLAKSNGRGDSAGLMVLAIVAMNSV